MAFVYDLTVDPDAENNTHAFALQMIGHNKSVLEVGCATGYFTKVLAERGCTVVGMELDPKAAKLAEPFAERIVIGNANDRDVWEAVDDQTFDVVTFGDVLEHLSDPLAVLRIAKRKLKPSGFIVTSLPNVAHGDVRLALLHGSFHYRETGLLDRTHVRFFTLETIRELLKEAGLVVVDTRRVVMGLFQTEIGLRREDFPQAVIDEVRLDDEFETYQFVMKSVVDNGAQAVTEMAGRLDEMVDRVQELVVENRKLEEQLAELTTRAAEQYEAYTEERHRLDVEVEAWTARAAELAEQIAQLESELKAAAARAEEYGTATDALRAALEGSQQQYREILNSSSYRLAAPCGGSAPFWVGAARDGAR